MDITDINFKKIMSKFPTGVCIITTIDNQGVLHAVTISSFCSVSLHPHLVLFCLGKEATSSPSFKQNDQFTVNILSMHQFYLADHFANKSNQDKWENIELLDVSQNKCPVLSGVLGFLECKKEKILDGGDHDIIIGRVENLQILSEAKPLLYYNSSYCSFGDSIVK